MDIKLVRVKFADGSIEECSEKIVEGNIYRYVCRSGEVQVEIYDELISLSADFVRPLNGFEPIEILFDVVVNSRLLVLTTHIDVGQIYGPGFGYYNALAVDRTPTVEKPSDAPIYPPKFRDIDHITYTFGIPCWTYSIVIEKPMDIPKYSVFTLFKQGDEYIAILTLSNNYITSYLGDGLKIVVFIGREEYSVPKSWIVAIGRDSDPYRAIERCVYSASKVCGFRLRKDKRRPLFLDGLGWCSWNALLVDDLSHDNVIKIVKGLLSRGVPVSWVIIDDGWQKDLRKGREWFTRVLQELKADEKKFPDGLAKTVSELKNMGIKYVGLWHTINIHWSGCEENVLRVLGVDGYRFPYTKSYVPPPHMDKAYQFYDKFFRWVKSNGFDFVKIDNQWSIHALYWSSIPVGEAARNIEFAMQLALEDNKLDVLNCMSMAPENYCNFVLSNAMRVSIDYIPFWKADAKLHTMFSIYNALVFSHIAYPDYDMWITYDPYAIIHAVSRIFSGGPIYITDRHPEKTDVELLKKIVLPTGEVIKTDEPGLPTRDILLRDPYNEPVLLKIASRIGNSFVLALFNINRDDREINEEISLNILPYRVDHEKYVYYKVFKGEKGVIDRNGTIEIALKPLETEIIVFSPIENGKSVIGLKEYLLPPYPINIVNINGRIIVKPKVGGTLIYYKDGGFVEQIVDRDQIVEL
ncbi:raffinose synthase [Ignisphaera aggregans DSM 17230]|uniref:Raffinose synthase n=1 Tax=Ignisphaera aggregans (strain DSM 17230 / JCM 13409 / AQ1.S1) TaxID=583356 RepID=E0SQT3_IGNAA|nr:raffinose synthase [Ignisphaera aggregans DSM 17230]